MLVAGGSSARLLDEVRIAFAPFDRDEPGFSPLREMASGPTRPLRCGCPLAAGALGHWRSPRPLPSPLLDDDKRLVEDARH